MTKKLTNEEFNIRLKEKYGDSYVIVGTYINSATPIELIHTNCGRVINPRPNDLFSYNYTCNECRKDKLTLTSSNDVFNHKIKSISNGNLSLVSDYNGYKSKVIIHCSKHNLDYTTTAVNVTRKGRLTCPICVSGKKRKSQVKSISLFKKELELAHNGDIVAEGKYVNTHTKMIFRCKLCDNTFNSEPNSVLRISGCPYCNQYKGEVLIANTLNLLGIPFESQKKFNDLKDNRFLSYDFYIPEYNLLVEYNGEQHYKPITFFGGERAFKKQVAHDKLKVKYAEDNGYELLSIRYTTNERHIVSQLKSVLNN